MLNERTGRSVSYDKGAGTARVEVGSGSGTARETSGTALYDSNGGLVGVDIEPSSSSRVVVMVGRHEAVARTDAARLSVTRDKDGEVLSVVVHGVKP